MGNNSTQKSVGYNLTKAKGLLQIFDEMMQDELPTITKSPEAAAIFQKRYDEVIVSALWAASDLINEASDMVDGCNE